MFCMGTPPASVSWHPMCEIAEHRITNRDQPVTPYIHIL
jgi:hypothetical protein